LSGEVLERPARSEAGATRHAATDAQQQTLRRRICRTEALD